MSPRQQISRQERLDLAAAVRDWPATALATVLECVGPPIGGAGTSAGPEPDLGILNVLSPGGRAGLLAECATVLWPAAARALARWTIAWRPLAANRALDAASAEAAAVRIGPKLGHSPAAAPALRIMAKRGLLGAGSPTVQTAVAAACTVAAAVRGLPRDDSARAQAQALCVATAEAVAQIPELATDDVVRLATALLEAQSGSPFFHQLLRHRNATPALWLAVIDAAEDDNRTRLASSATRSAYRREGLREAVRAVARHRPARRRPEIFARLAASTDPPVLVSITTDAPPDALAALCDRLGDNPDAGVALLRHPRFRHRRDIPPEVLAPFMASTNTDLRLLALRRLGFAPADGPAPKNA